MKYSPFFSFLFSGLLCALLFSPVVSVAQNELVPAPGAVQLRRVWTQEGTHLAADEYGYNVWGGTDLTGDSIADFAVYRGVDNTWLFYAGGDPPSMVPFWSMDSVGFSAPYCGDFWGDGSLHMLFIDGHVEYPDGIYHWYMRRRLFAVTDSGVAEAPTAVHDMEDVDPPLYIGLIDIKVQDLDEDQDDEMAVCMTGVRRGYNGPLDNTAQVWLYMGGPDFTLESPSLIIKDTSRYGTPDGWEVRFADFDGDGRTDMVMGGSYPTGGPMLRFYWGDENSPWSWAERPPDRDLQLVDGQTGMKDILRFGFFNLDDHPGADIVGYTGGSIAGTSVYLSSQKNPRTRSFLVGDADRWYQKGFSQFPHGYLNDSVKRYEMLPLSGTIQNGLVAEVLVSGSSYGPDYDYEAWYAPALDGLGNDYIFKHGAAVGNVTGDGYGDYMVSDNTYGPFVNTGIVIVLAGGPEIPLDDTTLSVTEHPVAGESGGLYLWPNPVVDELHIAWKGNLKRIPARFAVFDLVGQEVVRGDVEPYRGAALWRCGSVAAGSYRVTLYDATGEIIATAPILKQ